MFELLRSYLSDAFHVSAKEQAEKLIIKHPHLAEREIITQTNNYVR